MIVDAALAVRDSKHSYNFEFQFSEMGDQRKIKKSNLVSARDMLTLECGQQAAQAVDVLELRPLYL